MSPFENYVLIIFIKCIAVCYTGQPEVIEVVLQICTFSLLRMESSYLVYRLQYYIEGNQDRNKDRTLKQKQMKIFAYCHDYLG